MRARNRPYCTFKIIREPLELTSRQREPAHVVDGPLTVHKNDDGVLAIQQFIDLLVNARRIGPKTLPQRHVHVSVDSACELRESDGTDRSGTSRGSILVRRVDGRA